MIIKKFTGKTEVEATEAAQKELGDGVVIMSVRQVKPKGIFAFFKPKLTEVTAALEEEPQRGVYVRKAQTPFRAPAADSTRSIEEKLENLQTLLEGQLQTRQSPRSEGQTSREEGREDLAGEVRLSEAEQPERDILPEPTEDKGQNNELKKFRKLVYDTMVENEVDEKYLEKVMEEIDKIQKPNMPFDYLLASIYQRMILKFGKAEEEAEVSQRPRILSFIGPTGVGKTTTIAKIASRYVVDQKKQVPLLTLDTYRIAAAEQLRTYDNILMVPFRVVYTEEELAAAIQDFQDYEYILVDTPGHSPQNREQLDNLKLMLDQMKQAAECRFYLVLSATTKYRDLIKIADSYRQIADYQLIFTKLDETATWGNMLNLKLFTDTP
ncbi:MAG: flagellar biosynthesis protein FlhF, partial [Acetatifactor sp.]|nr:flagellar biosynthesis protein FlhF [Acetatifactor sp.]